MYTLEQLKQKKREYEAEANLRKAEAAKERLVKVIDSLWKNPGKPVYIRGEHVANAAKEYGLKVFEATGSSATHGVEIP